MDISENLSVITPTTGDLNVQACIDSVAQHNLHHYLVVDGNQYWHKIQSTGDRLHIIDLPFNTHIGKHYGQRIYAGISQLVHTPYVAFLDEDNTLTADYACVVSKAIDQEHSIFTFARNIMNPDGTIIGQDVKESIGKSNYGYHLHDLNTFVFRAFYFANFTKYMWAGYTADRVMSEIINKYHYTRHKHTPVPVVNYRIREAKRLFYEGIVK